MRAFLFIESSINVVQITKQNHHRDSIGEKVLQKEITSSNTLSVFCGKITLHRILTILMDFLPSLSQLNLGVLSTVKIWKTLH